MSWKLNLRPASFRGVPFKTEETEISGGRRNTVYEYPQRDTPYVDDMGRKAREYPVTGFVIGSDYMQARDELLASLEAEGPGVLVHPTFGTIVVNLASYRLRESRKEGGMARFDLMFVESGLLLFPEASTSTGEKLISAAQSALNFLNALFAGRYSLKNLPNWARDAAGADLSNVYDSAETLIRQADKSGDWLASFNLETAKGKSAISSTSTLASATQAALTPSSTVVASLTSASGALGSITAFAASGNSVLAATGETTATDAVSIQSASNADALRALVRGSLLIEGLTLVSDAEVEVYQDAMAARNRLTAALDAEMLSTTDDDYYTALGDLRAALYEDLTTRARNSARLLDYTPIETTPALVLAYNLYEAGGRDLEIVTRNAVSNPNFVPAEEIKVLSV